MRKYAEIPPDCWKQILETLKEGICITDADGYIVYMNNLHAQFSGMPYEEMIGSRVQSFVPEKLDIVLNPLVIETGESTTSVQTIYDGRRIVMEANPVFDARGKTAYCVTYSRDVTVMADISKQFQLQTDLLGTFREAVDTEKDRDVPSPPRLFSSEFLRKMRRQVSNIAETNANILLLGETGVGKDVFARSLHALSGRKDQCFVKIDCGSIPENLIETELFGYDPGTFSGANKTGKIGLIESASGGTLYLDEIGELPLNMQVRLLRFLQDREIMRVGSTKPKKVDVRIIAATNKDLEEAVKRGEFRKDLYYRLCVVVLNIPPLRERREDILPLTHIFLKYYNLIHHRTAAFTKEAKACLREYWWPGNVRELENLVQRLVITCKDGLVTVKDLPRCIREPVKDNPVLSDIDLEDKTYKEVMREAEGRVLAAALHKYGNLTETARKLCMDRSTLFRKVQELEKNGIHLSRPVRARGAGVPIKQRKTGKNAAHPIPPE